MVTVRRYIRSSIDLNASFNNNLFVSKLLITIHLKGKYNYEISASPTVGCILSQVDTGSSRTERDRCDSTGTGKMDHKTNGYIHK